MPQRNNPFKPNSPVHPGMLSGRHKEIKLIENALLNTKDSNPSNILIIGERGIGKTSLILLAYYLAKGDIPIRNEDRLNFLTLYLSLDKRTGIIEFAKKLMRSIERELRKSQELLQTLKDIWQFIQRWEVAGVKIAEKKDPSTESEYIENLIYSLVDTAKLIRDSKTTGEYTKKDGIIVFIDEADNAREDLDLGTILKQLSERLLFENCNIIAFVLSGLPEVRNILKKSHESSLRLFDESELSPLSPDDCKAVVRLGLDTANKSNEAKVDISAKTLESITTFSEGYPHFLQQFAYSAYEQDTDNIIDEEDFTAGSYRALGLIGDKYYKDMYFGKIKQDSYRQVLRIMSEGFNAWITKSEIKEKFKGDKTTLNNAINALLERNIILRNPATRGQYRLQWMGFALWIKYFSSLKEPK